MQEEIVVAAQLDDGCGKVGLQQDANLRRDLIDSREAGDRRHDRRHVRIIGRRNFCTFDDRDIAVDDHRARQAANRGLRGQELAKSRAILIEQGLRSPDVERHRGDLVAGRLRALVEIGIRDLQ